MRRPTRAVVLAAGALSLLLSATGCGSAASTASDSSASASATSDGASDAGPLTLYNAQHEDLMQLLVDGFTKETGVKVQMRSGEDYELANQLKAEGARSPADVFVTENSPGMTLVDSAGLFAPLKDATLAQVPASLRPSDGDWTGFAGRSTVLIYNKTAVTSAQLPASILDLAGPAWKGKVGISPAGADFQAIVSAVIQVAGEAKAKTWLTGLKSNAKTYRGNSAVMQAVNRGEISAGVIYHYYWYKDQAEAGENSKNTEMHYFGGGDAGGFLSVSGAGVLKSSKKAAQAEQFVAFLGSAKGQQILADSAAMEYPISTGAAANPALKPLAELDPPKVDIATLNGQTTVTLMQQAGLL